MLTWRWCNGFGIGDDSPNTVGSDCDLSEDFVMLELIGFIALAYLAFRFLPAVLEAGFKFAVICLGLVAFIMLIGFFTQGLTNLF